jgi:MscS family membrane protein
MLHRRIRTDIGVRYRDAKQLPAITNAIEVMLRGDEDIAAEETIWVNLVDFASSSLTFRIYAFTKTTEWVQFQKIQQKIFLKVIEIIQQFDADIAFPTRTLDVPDNVNIVIDEKEK